MIKVYRQYTYIIVKYKIYMYELQKQEEIVPLVSFSGLFFMSANKFYIYRQCTHFAFSCNILKSKTTTTLFVYKCRHQIQCKRCVSGIIYIRYAQNRIIGKPNDENSRNDGWYNRFQWSFFPLILLPFLTVAQHNQVPEKTIS